MEDNWFVYQRTAGRITARPVGLKGWLSFIALVSLPLLIALLLGGKAMAVHPLAFAGLLLAALGLALWLLFRLVLAKGRRLPIDG